MMNLNIWDKIVQFYFRIADFLNIPRSVFLFIMSILVFLWRIKLYKDMKHMPEWRTKNILFIIVAALLILMCIWAVYMELTGRMKFD